MDALIDRDAARDTGACPSTLERVAEIFAAQLEKSLHPGAQLAIRRSGRLLLEAAGGSMRPGSEGPSVSPQTLFLIFSATKPWTALAIHMLAERGLLELDAPVARYWPEFARNGKESVTVLHVLSHQGGFPQGPRWLGWDLWRDRASIARAMEERWPRWVPGEDVGYHPLNFGWVLGELVHRIDGRSLGRFIAEEIAAPLGLRDTYLGLPSELNEHVADHVDLSGERDFVADFNRPEVRAAEVGAATGITTARDLTRFYAMLLAGGELDGVRIVKPETIARATRVVVDGKVDRTFQIPVRWALGFHLGGKTSPFGRASSPLTFGHTGQGSSMAWGDPTRDLAVAYLTNGVQDSLPNFERMREMSDAILSIEGISPLAPSSQA